MITEPWTTVIPLVIGAALAGTFSIFGGALQAGREHDRWIRQSRLEAYSEFLVAIDAWDSAATIDWVRVVVESPQDAALHRRHVVDAERRFAAAASRVYLIGPDIVRAAAEESHSLALDRAVAFEQVSGPADLIAFNLGDDAVQAGARSMLLALMNRAIGIGPRRRFRGRFIRVE